VEYYAVIESMIYILGLTDLENFPGDVKRKEDNKETA
jgi:hypothetical protein